MTKKVSTVEIIAKLNTYLEGLKDEGTVGICGTDIDEYIDALSRVATSLTKKADAAAKRREKKASALEGFKDDILSVITETPVTRDVITEQVAAIEGICEKYDLEEVTVSKVGARLTTLVDEGKVVKSTIKVGDRRLVGYSLAQ